MLVMCNVQQAGLMTLPAGAVQDAKMTQLA
jgi:hypothetical protein